MAIEKIEKVKKISTALLPQEPIEKIPDRDRFEALMRQQNDKQATQTQDIANVSREQSSLIEAVGEANRTEVNGNKYPSTEQLVAQTQSVVSQIDSLRNTLATPNLELKSSVRNLLRNKLSHVDDNLRVALQKAGIEYTPPEAVPVKENPIEHFLGLLTHSQYQLENLAKDVQIMHANRAEITPANMLLIQIKVGFIQQEMEFFTSVLTKSLDSTKTIMNVQI
ncbi:hypothetical protein [Parachlamydia sp. AcF125]|uniref:hypothetical protein n=1 Tax=Parachlamydia sp. AcF125 TaxID=2795736 RepID=UPI001BCA2C03|nr:hypothetical protein [Parachlamydia sp. AcF125]MBS4168166.1 hypothetical protein [Parachlamydia sp. AcF125]